MKAEDIDGYRGCDDLDSILEFIESKPKEGASSSHSAAAAAESSPNSEDDESLNDANLQQVEIFALYTAICHCHCLILKCSIAL